MRYTAKDARKAFGLLLNITGKRRAKSYNDVGAWRLGESTFYGFNVEEIVNVNGGISHPLGMVGKSAREFCACVHFLRAAFEVKAKDEKEKTEAEKLAEVTRPHITIYARRWFQKTYGNTYHSVVVYVNGDEVGRAAFEYGYGEQYLQTAHRLLQKAEFYPQTGETLPSGANRDYNDFLTDTREHRDAFSIQVTDVDRKKDL